MTKNKVIELLNAYSIKNIGDAAIYYSLRKLIPNDYETYCFLQDTSLDDNNLHFYSDKSSIQAEKFYISVGGDIFNNTRKHFITKRFLSNAYSLRKHNTKAFLFGQSIPGSCRGLSYKYLVSCLKRLNDVVVRDVESYRRLVRSGIRAKLSYDTAFCLETGKEAKLQAIKHYEYLGIDRNKSLIISIRGFNNLYPHDNDKFIDKLIKLIELSDNDGIRTSILIHSNVNQYDNDYIISKKIKARVKDLQIINPFDLVQNSSRPHELAMAFLECSRYIVGVRYHTSILSLASGRIPYNLYYSNKGRDLSDRLKIPGSSIENFDPVNAFTDLKNNANKIFDCSPIKKQVQSDFMQCFMNMVNT